MNFHNSRTGFKSFRDLRQAFFESFEKCLLPTIANSHPEQFAGCTR